MTAPADDVRVLGIIEELRKTNSLNEKKILIEQMLSYKLGSETLYWTYSPTITFGIDPRKLGIDLLNKDGTGKMAFRFSLVQTLLNDLSSRKLSGKAAEAEIIKTIDIFEAPGREILYGILRKDLRIGCGATLINSVSKDFIPQFKVMRAQSFEPKRIAGKEAWAEWKLDGYRATLICWNGNGGFFSRSGKQYDAMQFAVAPIMKVMRAFIHKNEDYANLFMQDDKILFCIDTELMVGMFSETGAVKRKSEQATKAEAHIFELLTKNEFYGLESNRGYLERRKVTEDFVRTGWTVLKDTFPDLLQLTPRFPVKNAEHVDELFSKSQETTLASYLARGDEEKEKELLPKTLDDEGNPKMLEGLIVKIADSPYEPKKSYNWLKVKAEETEDLIVIGAYPGEKETKFEHTLGGLICDRNGIEVRVGGGLSDKIRDEIWQDYLADKKIIDERFLEVNEFIGGKVIGRMIEVKFHEVTPDGSIRHSRFVRFRDDKQNEAA